MRRIIRNILVIIIIFITIFQPVAAKVEFNQKLYKDLSENKNPIPYIKIPDYQRLILKNGLTLFLAEDHQIPALFINGMIRGGRNLESKEIAGISDCMVDMMTTGTQNFGEKDLDQYKEQYAIQFNFKADNDYLSFSSNALISEEEQLIALVAEILQKPQFGTDYFQRKQSEWEQGLKHAKTQENDVLNLYFYNHLMEGHPYSFRYDLDLQLAALNRITPKELLQHYQRVVTPNNTILFVYGDFKPDRILELISNYFSEWPRHETKPKLTKVKENKELYGQIILVNKPDATQAKIKMGYNFFDQSFLDRNIKERVAFEIANQIYGGGDFESYLMNEIRSIKGFAYDIYADFFNHRLGGAYFINTSVKPEQACETITTIKQIMSDLKNGTQKITETEVFKIVNQRNAFFPEAFRYNESIITNLIMNVEFKDRDPNYLNKYIRLYNTVTAAKAQKAFTKYSFPEKLFNVIVGKKEAILPAFQEQGLKVKVIEL